MGLKIADSGLLALIAAAIAPAAIAVCGIGVERTATLFWFAAVRQPIGPGNESRQQPQQNQRPEYLGFK
jgi:hypothetical protein